MSDDPADNAASRTSPSPRPGGVTLADSISRTQRTIITITVLAATIMEVLDTSIVNVALPNMQGELGATLDEIGWVSTGYIISNVIVLPLTGWLSDYFGRKRYLFASVIIFTIASIGCGMSRTLSALVMCRILQGVGGAAFLSTAQATLMEIYPKHLHGFAQALFGMGVIMAPTLGPTVGGYLVDHYTWPWIFFVNIPVGILAAVFIRSHVPNSLTAGLKRAPDPLGIALLALGLGCLQTVLERGERDDWFEAEYIRVLTALATVGLVTFIAWQLSPRNKNCAIELRILANRNLAAGCVSGFCLGFALYGGVFLMPQYLQLVQAHTAQQTGLMLLPGGLATAMVMPGVGKFIAKYDARLLIGVGLVTLGTANLTIAARLSLQAPDEAFFFPLLFRGMGIGLQFVPLSLAALGTLRPAAIAHGAGLYNLFRQLGGSFGIALLATTLSRRQKFHYDRLAEHLSRSGAATQQRLTALTDSFVARGFESTEAQRAAFKALYGSVLKQAANMSFQDSFYILGCSCFVSIAFLFLFAKARNRAVADVH